jgi:hypothetical protein
MIGAGRPTRAAQQWRGHGRDIATRAFSVLARRCVFVVMRAPNPIPARLVHEAMDDLDIPSLPPTSAPPRIREAPPLSPLLPVSPSGRAHTGEASSARDASNERDDRAREAMSLPATMSPREACMRILVRRCALRVMHAATILMVLLFARVATAHSLDIGYLRIEGARVVLDLDRAAAALMLDAPNASEAALEARADELAAKTYARELPSTASGACTLDAPAMEVTAVTVRLTTQLRCPDGVRTWRFPFVTDTKVSPTFELLVKDVVGDRMTVVDRAAPQIAFGAATPMTTRHATMRSPRPGSQGRSMFLVGGLLVGVMLAPIARIALRR